MMKSCQVCGFENDEFAHDCEQCGTPTPAISEVAPGDYVKLFRALVVFVAIVQNGQIIFNTILFLFPQFRAEFYSAQTLEAFAWAGHGALFNLPPTLMYFAVFLHIAASVGLWRFSRPARFVYSGLIVFWYVVWSVSGLSVGTAFEANLSSAWIMCEGAVVVMMWTRPFSERFVRL